MKIRTIKPSSKKRSASGLTIFMWGTVFGWIAVPLLITAAWNTALDNTPAKHLKDGFGHFQGFVERAELEYKCASKDK